VGIPVLVEVGGAASVPFSAGVGGWLPGGFGDADDRTTLDGTILMPLL
jgi:hypothetical protein